MKFGESESKKKGIICICEITTTVFFNLIVVKPQQIEQFSEVVTAYTFKFLRSSCLDCEFLRELVRPRLSGPPKLFGEEIFHSPLQGALLPGCMAFRAETREYRTIL